MAAGASGRAAIWLGIAALAQPGAVLRVWLQKASIADRHQFSSVLYANFIGSFILGFVTGAKPYLDKRSMSPWFYAIGTGFCGALTSFSTWMFEVSRWLVLWPNSVLLGFGRQLEPHERAYSAFSGLLVDLGVSYLAFEWGRQCGASRPEADEEAPLVVEQRPSIKRQRSQRYTRRSSTLTSCTEMHGLLSSVDAEEQDDKEIRESQEAPQQACGFAALLLATTLGMGALVWSGVGDPVLLFTVLFAPPGALLRYWLGARYNSWPDNFRLGTLMANLGACVVMVLVVAAMAAKGCFDMRPWLAAALRGVSSGFCGSLSTMSTFVAQLHEMDQVHALAYGLISWGTALALMCSTLGAFLAFTGASSVCM